MNARKITLLPGDLIGRDLAGPITELLAAAGAELSWERIDQMSDDEHAVTPRVLESVRRNGVALRAPLRTPDDRQPPTVALRKSLDLYAGVRHVRNLPGIPSRYEGIDLAVIRENTEDVYSGAEHEVHPGVVQSMKVVTRAATERIFRFAYRYARQHGRRKLAIVHKANIMKMSDGLWLKVGREVAEEYPDIETSAYIVDNCCMQLVQRPHQFGVLVCGNLYGDIISDLAAGLVGGISAVWGADQGDDLTVFEAIHGRVPELMGQDVANPMPLLLPAIKLLEHVGQTGPAERLEAAVATVLKRGETVTADLGGSARTSEMLAAIRAAL